MRGAVGSADWLADCNMASGAASWTRLPGTETVWQGFVVTVHQAVGIARGL